MSKFNRLKLKSFIIQMFLGILGIVIGIQILYAILSEISEVYHSGSKYAYICGIISCGLLIFAGVLFVFRAYHFDKQLFRGISKSDKAHFMSELSENTTLSFGTYLIITKHYIVVRVKGRGAVFKLVKINDLIACFGRPFYAASDELVQYDIVLCDDKFRLSTCHVKNKDAAVMEKAYNTIMTLAPWVITEDYFEFISNHRKKARQKAYLKMIDHRKNQSEVAEDTIPEVLISAADLIQAFEEKQRLEETDRHKKKKRRKFKIHKKRDK